MLKFVVRMTLFVAMTLMIYAVAYICCNYNNYVAVGDALDCEVLSPCNSHEQCGIDPEIFREYGNLNSIASLPWVWEAKLRLVLGTGRCHPKYLIVDRGCHEILWGYSDDDVAQLVARFLPLQLIYGTCPYEIDWQKVAGYAIGSRSFTTVWAAKPPVGRPKGIHLQIAGRVAEHFNKSGVPSQEVIRKFILSLESLVEFAIENGIEPVMVSTPKHRGYLAAEPQDVRRVNRMITQRLVEKYRLRYLDYSAMPLDDDSFADADHLNPLGRSIFTRKLMADLGYRKQ